MLHAQQDRDQRLFEFLVEPLQLRYRCDLRPQRVMQLQGDIGIFGRIFRRLVHRHLVESELFRALAGNIREGNGLNAQIRQRCRIHVMPGGDTVEDIRLQHRIEAHAGQPDTVIQQDVGVVFQVMSDLAALGILEYRAQHGERLLAIQLIGGAGIVVLERQIGRDSRCGAERYADDLGFHVIQIGRFGVERKQLALVQHREPALQVAPLHDGFVVPRGRGERR